VGHRGVSVRGGGARATVRRGLDARDLPVSEAADGAGVSRGEDQRVEDSKREKAAWRSPTSGPGPGVGRAGVRAPVPDGFAAGPPASAGTELCWLVAHLARSPRCGDVQVRGPKAAIQLRP
jgi:hypothetical protein